MIDESRFEEEDLQDCPNSTVFDLQSCPTLPVLYRLYNSVVSDHEFAISCPSDRFIPKEWHAKFNYAFNIGYTRAKLEIYLVLLYKIAIIFYAGIFVIIPYVFFFEQSRELYQGVTGQYVSVYYHLYYVLKMLWNTNHEENDQESQRRVARLVDIQQIIQCAFTHHDNLLMERVFTKLFYPEKINPHYRSYLPPEINDVILDFNQPRRVDYMFTELTSRNSNLRYKVYCTYVLLVVFFVCKFLLTGVVLQQACNHLVSHVDNFYLKMYGGSIIEFQVRYGSFH